jgi:hypothetical protein
VEVTEVATRLHELLAVEGNLKGQAEKVRTDLASSFEKKRHLFTEKLVTFKPSQDGAEPVVEEQLDLQSTVRQELTWVTDIWAQALDVSATVAEANTQARGDVVLDDGSVILKGMPATALLELEKRLAEVQTLLQAVPTLDPAKGFKLDDHRGKGIYRARDDVKTRTKKVQRPIVLYDATPEHPAQTQLISEDVPVGEIRTQEWSGLVTPLEKSEMLDRVEALRRAVKAARSRANEVEVSQTKIGTTLFRFMLDGQK